MPIHKGIFWIHRQKRYEQGIYQGNRHRGRRGPGPAAVARREQELHDARGVREATENGDYLYGKKRLREIDRRIRFLTKRLETAEIVDPAIHGGSEQVYFGATVAYVDDLDVTRTITIMGIDEADSSQGQVSWISPVARALLKARVGDEVMLPTPAGTRVLEILSVSYPQPIS